MIIAKNLPAFLWDEAVAHTTYLRNQVRTCALEHGETPHEVWNKWKPNISHLREFGCDVWVLDEDKTKSKLAPKSKMILTRYMDGPKAIRYYDAATRTIKILRNFTFNENDVP
jgi:hypothetical protein